MENESWSDIPYEDVIGPILKKSVSEVAIATKTALEKHADDGTQIYKDAMKDLQDLLDKFNIKDNLLE